MVGKKNTKTWCLQKFYGMYYAYDILCSYVLSCQSVSVGFVVWRRWQRRAPCRNISIITNRTNMVRAVRIGQYIWNMFVYKSLSLLCSSTYSSGISTSVVVYVVCNPLYPSSNSDKSNGGCLCGVLTQIGKIQRFPVLLSIQ